VGHSGFFKNLLVTFLPFLLTPLVSERDISKITANSEIL